VCGPFTLVGYGDAENLMHSAEGFTHANGWQGNSSAGVMKVADGFHKGGGSSSPLRPILTWRAGGRPENCS
jgi:hypothetical protein